LCVRADRDHGTHNNPTTIAQTKTNAAKKKTAYRFKIEADAIDTPGW